MKHAKSGSALLLCITVLSGLALTCLVCWKSCIFSFECMLEKQKYEARYQLVRGLHDYGIWFFGKHLAENLQKLTLDKEFTLYFSAWPHKESLHNAKIAIKQHNDNKLIKAQADLYERSKIIGQISWHFTRQGDDGAFYYEVDGVKIS